MMSNGQQKRSLSAFLVIIRPQNCIIGGITVLAGILMSNKMFGSLFTINELMPLLLLGYFTYFFIAAAGNVVNDYYDIEIDKINRPHRPLPSGKMSLRQAKYYIIFLSAIGSLLALFTHIFAFLVALIFIIVGFYYASKVKILGIWGNFTVAFSFSFGIFYGAFIYGTLIGNYNIHFSIILFFMASFFILQARETIKGMEDIEGDKLRDVRTIARVYGLKTAAVVAIILNTIGVISFFLIWYFGYAGVNLIILLILGGSVVIFSSISLLINYKSPKHQMIASTLDKLGALIGLISYILIAI